MKVVTEKDVELHQKKLDFLQKFFKKTYDRHGIGGFITIDNPPNSPDELGSILASRFEYHGRYFKAENKWYFSKEYLGEGPYTNASKKQSELRRIEDAYHSDLEYFILTAKRDLRIQKSGPPFLYFQGYQIIEVKNDGTVAELVDGPKTLKLETRDNSKSTYILKGSTFKIRIPCALIRQVTVQRNIKYDTTDIVHFNNSWEERKDWKIQPYECWGEK